MPSDLPDTRPTLDATLGMLPALGGSLSDLRRHGQLSRLMDHYVPAYLERFARLRWFAYEHERIEDFTDDPEVRARMDVVAPSRGGQRHVTAARIAREHGALLRDCALVRVFQAPGSVPAMLARARYVCTYGYDYRQFTELADAGRLADAKLAAKRRVMTVGLSAVLRRAEATIVTTVEGHRAAAELGARRILDVPNGVDLQALVAPEGERDLDVVFVGRLVEQKDLPTLVRALALAPSRPRATIVGDGPLRGALEAQARELGVTLDLAGRVPNEDVPALLHRARVFALPSLFEGHPKALLEAMAGGAACVGTDIPGIGELGRDGGVALVPVGDAEALAAAIERLLGDDEGARRLAARGRELAVERFDLATLLARETTSLVALAGGAA